MEISLTSSARRTGKCLRLFQFPPVLKTRVFVREMFWYAPQCTVSKRKQGAALCSAFRNVFPSNALARGMAESLLVHISNVGYWLRTTPDPPLRKCAIVKAHFIIASVKPILPTGSLKRCVTTLAVHLTRPFVNASVSATRNRVPPATGHHFVASDDGRTRHFLRKSVVAFFRECECGK